MPESMLGNTKRENDLSSASVLCSVGNVNRLFDEETVQWSEARYNDIVTRLSPYLKTVGYNIQRDVTFLPVSGLRGFNLKDGIPDGLCPWYKGPTLFEILDHMEIGGRDPNAPLRLPVLDKFNDRGCIITGKVESGRLVGERGGDDG